MNNNYIKKIIKRIISGFELLFEEPLVVFELVHFVCLPVDCIYTLIQRVCYRRHLEREYIVL